MKYVKLTFQYMRNKHFWKLALLSIVPSVMLALVSSFGSTIKLFIGFFNLEEFDFKTIHRLIDDRSMQNINWLYYVSMVLILLLLTIILSIFIGTMQRHMRTGKFQITNIAKRVNENFMPSFLSLLAVYIFIFLYGISVSVVMSLWFTITHNKVATFVLSLIFMIGAFFVMVLVIALFSMTAPNIVCTGQKILDSVSLSIRTVGANIFKLSFAFIFPLIPLFAIQIGISFANIRLLQFFTDFIMMVVLSCYYPVLIFVSYYDLFDRDREDLLPENRL